MPVTIQLWLEDEHATEILGAALAEAYRRSNARNVAIYLRGQLGTGKTTCARSMLRSLGVSGAVRSPSYTLLEVYRIDGEALGLHLDLYRLTHASEIEELGLRDYLAGTTLMLIEWPERGADALPLSDLALTFDYEAKRPGRKCTVEAGTLSGLELSRSLVLHAEHLTRPA